MCALQSLVPADRHDIAAAERAVAAGYPAVAPVLGELLTSLQDCNYPVAFILSPFLASIGVALAPHVRTVLCSNDDVWKYWVLERLVAPNPPLIEALRPELERIFQSPSAGEVNDEVLLRVTDILSRREA